MNVEAMLEKMDRVAEARVAFIELMLKMKIPPEIMIDVLGPLVAGAAFSHKLPYDERIALLERFNAEVMECMKETAKLLEGHQ